MFENLRKAFREAADNFKTELGRDEIPEVVDGLLRQMQQEVTEAQAQIYSLEEQLKRALQLAELEAGEVATCRRREALATRIADEETAKVAAEFAAKHERRKAIQERKALALREELELKRGEVADMLEKLKEARAKRESLSATSGRSSARGSIGEADDLFAELDRMAEQIHAADSHRMAEADLMAELDALESPSPSPQVSPAEDAEARLQELKRRMGKE
jgi:phage shock protein A